MNIKNAINKSAEAWDDVSLATDWCNKVGIENRPAHPTNEEQEENELSCLMELSCSILKSQFNQTLDVEECVNA